MGDKHHVVCRVTPGFTLIEVLVAVVIVAVAFTALLGLHNRNLVLVGRDQNMTQATLLLRQLVAEVELLPEFAEYGTATGSFEGYPGFHWQREVASTALDDLRQVRLTVMWGDSGRYHAELDYYVRRPAT